MSARELAVEAREPQPDAEEGPERPNFRRIFRLSDGERRQFAAASAERHAFTRDGASFGMPAALLLRYRYHGPPSHTHYAAACRARISLHPSRQPYRQRHDPDSFNSLSP